MPLCVPTNTRPPAMAGWPSALSSPGKPKAHFTFSFGTSAAVTPAAAASWYRVLRVFTPQPFHAGPASGLANSPAAARHIACGDGWVLNASANGLPVTNSAIARRSTPVRPLAIDSMAPDSSAANTRSDVICCSTSRAGARPSPASWHEAHSCL